MTPQDQAAEARRAEIADLIREARLVDGLRGHAHVATGQAKGYMLDAADWIDAAKAELSRLTDENERYGSALENAGKTILDKGADVTRLEAALAAREGYVLVPVEPTKEMRRAGRGPWATGDKEEAARATYRAMVAAAGGSNDRS